MSQHPDDDVAEYGWLTPILWGQLAMMLAVIVASVLLLVATSHAAVRP